MKPALYWSIIRGAWSTRYSVFAVTSDDRKTVYGREDGLEPTHVARSNMFGRFDSEQAARDRIAEVEAIQTKYRELCQPHTLALNRLHAEEDAALKEALK